MLNLEQAINVAKLDINIGIEAAIAHLNRYGYNTTLYDVFCDTSFEYNTFDSEFEIEIRDILYQLLGIKEIMDVAYILINENMIEKIEEYLNKYSDFISVDEISDVEKFNKHVIIEYLKTKNLKICYVYNKKTGQVYDVICFNKKLKYWEIAKLYAEIKGLKYKKIYLKNI